MVTEGAIENVCIKVVSVLRGFLSSEANQTVCNNEVSVLNGCPWSGGDCTGNEPFPNPEDALLGGRKNGLKPWAWRIELGKCAKRTLWRLFLKTKMLVHMTWYLTLDWWWFFMCFVRNSLLTLCCATTLDKTTEALPHFLSPYLVDLLIQVGTLFWFHPSQAAHVDLFVIM